MSLEKSLSKQELVVIASNVLSRYNVYTSLDYKEVLAMTTGTLNKWGNSQGVIIPKDFCDRLGIKPGDKVNISLKDDKIIIEPEREFTLSALMAGYSGSLPEEYDWGKPTGKELW